MKEKIFDKEIKLERFNGKGGWTYARISEPLPLKCNHFGYARVNGFIDHYELIDCALMPMGKGVKFIPVNATIRKQIKKQEGDLVHLVLFVNSSSISVPHDFIECLKDDPDAELNFKTYPEVEKQKYLTWIEAAAAEEDIVERMAKAIQKIGRKEYLL
jgi:hypothetical protein